MLLTADIGNTSITLGIFEGDEIVGIYRISSNIHYSIEKYEELLSDIIRENVTECIIASVVNGLDITLAKAIRHLYGIESIILNNDLDLGLKIKIDDNNELGADRIANGVAVKCYRLPVIVIDFGTANTFDIVNSKGEFVGGIIAPGINTQLNSLSKCTSKLPNLEPEEVEKSIGTNTINSIMSGVIRGTACMIDGMLDECEKELGEKATVVITGGNGKLVSQYMKHSIDEINPTLTLQGLKELYKLNSHRQHLQHQSF